MKPIREEALFLISSSGKPFFLNLAIWRQRATLLRFRTKLVSVIKTDPLDDKVQEYGVLMQYQDIIGETVAEIQTVQISLEPVREILDPFG